VPSNAVVIGEQCRYCSKFRAPADIMRLPGNVRICHSCYAWHQQALRLFSGEPPSGCQECGITFADLDRRSVDGNVEMYVHAKDGIYQVLCPACSDRYMRKRKDLYGGTPFGRKEGLE